MLHARDDFLADIAALAEIEPAEIVHVGVMREGVAKGEVAPDLGDTQTDAVGVIGRLVHFIRARTGERGFFGEDRAPAERGEAGVGEDDAIDRRRLSAPERHDLARRALIGDRHLGAQPIERHALHEVGDAVERQIEQETVAVGHDEEVGLDLSLRREQRAEAGLALRRARHIVRHDVLQEALAVGACDPHYAAIAEPCMRPITHRHGSHARRGVVRPRALP